MAMVRFGLVVLLVVVVVVVRSEQSRAGMVSRLPFMIKSLPLLNCFNS